MRTIVVSLVMAALLIGTALVAAPTVQADAPYPETLVICQLPFTDRTAQMTGLQCQNMGGKEVRSDHEAGKGK